ncbi:hypothetical protein EJB05_18065, partial [Eragrostis curvula]
MADDDYDGLPLYVEEDEAEAAAAKQKRRQQSRKPPPPPPPPPTPEEKARKEQEEAMLEKLYEYDPKLGYGYNRIWFVGGTFDHDEETQFGPMRFTNSIIRDDHVLTDSLNVLSLKINSSDVGFPINVYGTVIVRDRLDLKCMHIFRRSRDNCQLVQSEVCCDGGSKHQGVSLILTGPSRRIAFHCEAYFEIDLKIKEDTGDSDIQFCKALLETDVYEFESNVKTRTVASWLSEVDLILAYVKRSLEGTIEIRMLSGPEAFYGKLTACTTDVPAPIMLYDSDIDDSITLCNERVIQLLRRVVAVSENQMLRFHVYARSGDQNAIISHRICEFTPLIKGADKTEVTCGVYKLQIKVTWSTLLDGRR